MAPNYCPHCGAKSTALAAKFCGNCGESLGSFEKRERQSTQSQAVRRPSRFKRGNEDEPEGDEDSSDIDYVPEINGLDVEIEISHSNVFQVTENGIRGGKMEVQNSDIRRK